MTHQPLIVGQLNDGMEPAYPGTDVPRLAKYVQAILAVELTDRLESQLPGWTCVQGDTGTPVSDRGIAIAPNLMTVEESFWTPLVGKNQALTVRVDFGGSPLSLITAHRPIASQQAGRQAFDQAITSLWKVERKAGRVPILGIDTNESNPTSLQVSLNAAWTRPYDMSIVGLMLPHNVEAWGCVSLSKDGEHPPVICLTKVPVS